MAKKKVIYNGPSATQHRLGILRPGINEFEESVADKFLATGLVKEYKEETKMTTNAYENKHLSSNNVENKSSNKKKHDGGKK